MELPKLGAEFLSLGTDMFSVAKAAMLEDQTYIAWLPAPKMPQLHDMWCSHEDRIPSPASQERASGRRRCFLESSSPSLGMSCGDLQ